MDRSVAPCTDFYDYANGAWRSSNPIPDYMDRWSRRWQSGELNKEHVRDILDELSKKSDWQAGSSEQLSGDYYAACMDERRVEARGLQVAEPLLKEIAAIKTRDDLQRVIGHLQDIGLSVPFDVGSQQDIHDPDNVIAEVEAGGLGMPDRDYYLKPEDRFVDARAKYLDHVAHMLVLAGASAESSRADARVIFDLEKRLARASLDNVALRDPANTDHKMNFASLAALAPDFDWPRYFDAAKLPRGELNVDQPQFLQAVNIEITRTPLADWRAYLRWQLLHDRANVLPDVFGQENFAFYGRYLSGQTQRKPQWKRCAELIDAQVGEAFGKVYVQRYFPPEAKSRAQEMVRNLIGAMGDTIRGVSWMSPETRARALEKLSAFNMKIGYPDNWKEYRGVLVTRTKFWEDVESSERWNVEDRRAQAGKPVDRGRWGMTPPTSNAYYNSTMNEIVFPAGILQPPGFDPSATDAVNYGAIGVVIGHEITHGFDDQGAKFDGHGRLDNWWTAQDMQRFEERGACVAHQFDSYFIEPNIHHNGRLVLGESIADLGGAKLAFLAYKKSREGKPPEPTIDGFTPEQQFFIAWGQFRGDETRPATQRKMIQGDPHPVAKFRVLGPLSNLPAFQETFQCKADAPMVRPAAERCEVW
jgi:endothelin-converting enzyme/putative endopeptidase